MMYTIIVTLLIATNGITRLQADPDSIKTFFEDFLTSGSSDNSFTKRMDSSLSSHNSQSDDTQANRVGSINFFGSQTYQSNNKYPEGFDRSFLASKDVQVGNIFPDNPNGINVYGPILKQVNNTYYGKKSNGTMRVSVTQIGNVYPKNPGKNDTYGPIVTQKGNIYPDDSGNNTVIGGGVIVNQINNTYPQALEGNEDALNPIIQQDENVYPSINKTNSVIGAIINRSGNNFHSSQDHPKIHSQDKGTGVGITESQAHPANDSASNSQTDSPSSSDDFNSNAQNREKANNNSFHDHHERPDARITVDMVKREHEKMKRIIYHHLQTDYPTSKRCANGMTDSKRLDQINSLYIEVKTQLSQLKALKNINRNYKIMCNTIANQCSKHDNMRKWIASAKQIVIRNIQKSRAQWESLRMKPTSSML